MTEPGLLTVCLAAFVAVLFLLALLAGVIRLLTAIFPEARRGPDAAVVAAISAAVATAYPGTRVTSVEETP